MTTTKAEARPQASQMGDKITSLATVFIVATFILRTLTSGVAAELNAPWDNAFIDGLLLLSAMLVAGGTYLSGERQKQRLDLAPGKDLALPLFAVLILLPVGVLPATNIDIAMRSALSFGAIWLFFAALLRFLKSQDQCLQLLSVGAALSLIITVLGLYEYVVEYPQLQKLLAAGQLELPDFNEDQMREFRYRIESTAAVGPFLISNLLGGYLAMWWPLLLMVTAWLWKRQRRAAALMSLVALAILVLGMVATRSKGIIPSSLAAFWLLLWLWPETKLEPEPTPRLSKRRKALLAITVLGCLVMGAGLAIFAKNREAYGLGLSFQVRLEYWQAAVGMARKKPVTGLGLGNYRAHYSLHKVKRSEETKFAHNTVFQVLADQGLAGIFVYLWLFIAFARSLVTSTSKSKAKARAPPKIGLLCGGVISGFLFLTVTTGRYDIDFSMILAMALVLFFAYGLHRLLDSPELDRRDDYLRAGLVAGLGAFVVHGAFDFSFHSHGLLLNAVWLGALALRLKTPESNPPAPWIRALWVLPLLAAFVILLLWPSTMRIYGEHFTLGRERLFLAKQEAPKDTARALKRLEEAAVHFKQARDSYSVGLQVHLQLASVYQAQWRLSGYRREFFEEAKKALDDAIRCDLLNAALQFHKGQLLEEAMIQRMPVGKDEVLLAYDKAAALYPTHPRYHFYGGALRLRLYEATLRNPLADATKLKPLKTKGRSALLRALQINKDARQQRVKLTKEQIEACNTLLEKSKD
jgi:hypothetical protein